jgi:hypothetical protein
MLERDREALDSIKRPRCSECGAVRMHLVRCSKYSPRGGGGVMLEAVHSMTPAEWNAKYPVGTPVIVHRDNGQLFETRTRSEAGGIPSNPGVIWVEGIVGCYSLDRVQPISSAADRVTETFLRAARESE